MPGVMDQGLVVEGPNRTNKSEDPKAKAGLAAREKHMRKDPKWMKDYVMGNETRNKHGNGPHED